MQEESSATPADRSIDPAFTTVMDPKYDFLPGSMLANDQGALEASRKVVERAIFHELPKVDVSWDGTIATVKDQSGHVIDRVEIHGASYDRTSDEASGVRFDMTGVKLQSKRLATVPNGG